MNYNKYDICLIGTGFASSFFLLEYLRNAPKKSKILVLEAGEKIDYSWMIEKHRHSNTIDKEQYHKSGMSEKEWRFTIGFGGGSNCWTATTNRFLESDFRLKTLYGVGRDWPMSYDEIEPYYSDAENIMQVSGEDTWSLSPRSRSFPQPAHKFNAVDKILKNYYPDHYFHVETARARIPTQFRPSCCGSGVCEYCPIAAKFVISRDLAHIYADPRVEVIYSARVSNLVTRNNKIVGANYTKNGSAYRATADIIALGANAIFNPVILENSEIKHPYLGKYLHEQISKTVHIDLDGIENFQGSTEITGQGYMFYDGEHRSEYGGCILQNFNIPNLRKEFGKWRQRMVVKFVVEALPLAENHVSVSSPGLPIVHYQSYSKYGLDGLSKIPDYIAELSKSLPIENARIGSINTTEAHIQGTVLMGEDPETSIVDKNLRHHIHKNLFVLGSSSFPTCTPANPTLTISALSLKAAKSMFET